MSKLLDLADKYDSIQDDYQDDEPTLKMVRPLFPEEKSYPGVGLIITLTVSAIFWVGMWYSFGFLTR